LSNWIETVVVDPGADAWREVAEDAAAALEEAAAATVSTGEEEGEVRVWPRRRRESERGEGDVEGAALATTMLDAPPALAPLALLRLLPTHACAHADT